MGEEKKTKICNTVNTVLLSFMTFILSIMAVNLKTMNDKLEKVMVENGGQEAIIENNRVTISKNTFRIEQLEQMKSPATSDRFTARDAENLELKVKSWTRDNFIPKSNRN